MVKGAELNVIFDLVRRLRHPKYLGTQADSGNSARENTASANMLRSYHLRVGHEWYNVAPQRSTYLKIAIYPFQCYFSRFEYMIFPISTPS